MTVSASAAGHATAAPPRQQRKVAVIGAGAAGLVSIRELLKEGHQVCVYAATAADCESPPQQESCAAKTCLFAHVAQVVGFELGSQPGGTWVYDPNTDSDILGADRNRRKVHSSMYR